jgi:integrase
MPSVQRGSVVRKGGKWGARWYDETGARRFQGGFATRSAAREWVDGQAKEVLALRRGDLIPQQHRPKTVRALLDTFETRHGATVDPATLRTLKSRLKHARGTFGDRHPDSLNRLELEDWRATLSAGNRHDVFRAFRQALAWGTARSLTSRDASVGIKNPKRNRYERREVFPFETWADVDKVADELDPRFRAIPVFAVGTGLRPEEFFALERADVDREARLVHVRRRYSGGELKQGGKTAGSVRAVPLRQRVLDALDAMPVRIDTPILFPAARGGHIDIEKFRHREWAPALRAAGIDHRRINDCRHTFATWAIEEGSVHHWHLATIMGTSVTQLEDTYARWLKRTDDQLRTALDAYDARLAHAGTQS